MALPDTAETSLEAQYQAGRVMAQPSSPDQDPGDPSLDMPLVPPPSPSALQFPEQLPPPQMASSPLPPAPGGVTPTRSINELSSENAKIHNTVVADQNQLAKAKQVAADNDVALAEYETEQLDPIKDQAVTRAQQHTAAAEAIRNAIITKGDAQLKSYNEAVTEASKMTLDPDEVWGGSDGRKALGAIALFLGTFANGMSGGRIPNTALQILNGSIQRSVDRQKFASQLAQNKAQGGLNQYQMMRQRLGDDQQAEAALYNSYQEQVAKMIDRQVSLFKTPEARAAGEKLKLQIAQEAADKGATAHKDFLTNEEKAWGLRLQSAAVSVAAGKNNPNAATQLAGVQGPAGAPAVQKAEAEKWGAVRASAEMLDDAINRLKTGELSVGSFRELMTDDAILHAGLKVALDMGKRLEGNEGKDLVSLTPSAWDAVSASFGADPGAAIRKIEAGRDALIGVGLRRLTSSNKYLSPDQNDPIVGPWLQRKSAKLVEDGARSQMKPKAAPSSSGVGARDVNDY